MRTSTPSDGTAAEHPGPLLYRAVWRWHFIAGLAVLPFLMLLSLTGAAYLFKAEIDHTVYARWDQVDAQGRVAIGADALIARVQRATQGQVLQLSLPAHPTEAVRLVTRVDTGEARTVFADPYDGRVLGSTGYGGVMQVIRKLHSLQRFGFWASSLIEVTAGWCIALVILGLYLWWPRARSLAAVLSVRGHPRERIFWRDLHAVVGLFAAVLVLFLAVTGLPWSMYWGNHLQSWASARGLGQSPPPAKVIPDWQVGQTQAPGRRAPEHVHAELPWALQQVAAPAAATVASSASVDQILAAVHAAGLRRPYSLTLPQGPGSAYMAAYRPARVEETRVLYLDPADGHVLGDEGYDSYGAISKMVEWGAAVHQGIEYGAANRYLMLSGCIAILALAGTAIPMWLKRRRPGTWGLPPLPGDPAAMRTVTLALGVLGILFPLVGLSLVTVVVIEAFARALQGLHLGRGGSRP